jgi:hypothetical protein
MNFFDFGNDATQHTVSPLFWLYWAVAIPLTVAVLTVWKVWGSRRRRYISAAAPAQGQGKGQG